MGTGESALVIGDALAEASGVTRLFGRHAAVRDVDLTVAAGEVVGLLGANGAGKTTLIRLLLGLLTASGGAVRLFGEAPSRRTRRRLGYVPQGLGLYEDLTAAENLDFARAVFGRGTAARRPPPDSPARVPVGRLSLGLQRRAAFAEALDHGPELLVLDEPTSGVDTLARTRLWETIRDATDAGAGALVSTHHMDEAEECDRLVVMAAGRVVAGGTVARITGGGTAVVVETGEWSRAFDALQGAGLPAALVGTTLRVPSASVAAVSAALGGLPVRLREEPVTLEERFLELVRGAGAPGSAP